MGLKQACRSSTKDDYLQHKTAPSLSRPDLTSSVSLSSRDTRPRAISSAAAKNSPNKCNKTVLPLSAAIRILCRSLARSWQGSTSTLTRISACMSRISSTTKRAKNKTRSRRSRRGASPLKSDTKTLSLSLSSTRRSLTRCSTAGTSQIIIGYSSWRTWSRGRSHLSTSWAPRPRPDPSYFQPK